MKKIIGIITITALSLLTIASCGSCKKTVSNNDEKVPVCGGYSDWRAVSDSDVSLFNKAIGDQYKDLALVPTQVQTQVVAGLNYKFLCESVKGKCEVHIYKSLEGELEVTSVSFYK